MRARDDKNVDDDMKLIELTLKNFKIFKGTQSVKFPTEPTRNFMFVFGTGLHGGAEGLFKCQPGYHKLDQASAVSSF